MGRSTRHPKDDPSPVQSDDIVRFFQRLKGVYYGWWMAGVAAFVMCLGSVPLFQGMAVWNPVLRGHFGWSRSQLALAFSLTRVEGSIMGPIAGYIIDKIGPRSMVFVGLSVMGGGFLIFSQVRELWHLYVAFIVMSAGAGMGAWLPMMTVLNSWFIRRRSMAMACAMEGYSLGGIALLPALAWAIDPDEIGRFGWRMTAAGIGVFALLAAFPISRLIRNRPEDYGLQPDGAVEPATVTDAKENRSSSSKEEMDYRWQDAVHSRTFWLMSIGQACSSIVVVTMMVHVGLLLDDEGFSIQTIGWVVAVYTGTAAVFTPIGGYIGDRMTIRNVIFAFSVVQSIAIIVLLQADGSYLMVFLFAALLGMGHGGRFPLTTAIRGVYFGRRAFASITGMSMIPMNISWLLAPYITGKMHDIQGSYNDAFYGIAAISLIGSCLFLLLGNPKAVSSSSRPTPL